MSRRVVWITLVFGACSHGSGPTDPGTKGPIAPGPDPSGGAIQATVETRGEDLDSDGYVLMIDGRTGGQVGANDTILLARLTPGSHSLELVDIEWNCSVGGMNPRGVTVVAQEILALTFDVLCNGISDFTGLTTMDLGPMPGATGWTWTLGIADDGAVAGYGEFPSGQRAFYRSPRGEWIDLHEKVLAALPDRISNTVAWDVSNDYLVVGTVNFNASSQRPVVWHPTGSDWRVVPLPGNRGVAFGINGTGTAVAGAIVLEDLRGRRFAPAVWTAVGTDRWELDALSGEEGSGGLAQAVNDGPMGRMVTGRIGTEAVVWMEQGTGWSLPVILPKPPGFSRGGGLGINDRGDVAGSVSIGFQDERAVLWERVGNGWNVTQVTPGNESDSHANDVSNSGQVVGAISHSFTQRPFLWREGRLQLLGAGGTAMEINDSDQFTGMGVEYRHAMVWEIH